MKKTGICDVCERAVPIRELTTVMRGLCFCRDCRGAVSKTRKVKKEQHKRSVKHD